MRRADGSNTEDGNTNGGDDKANHGRKDVPTSHLSEMDREDQIAGTEEHPEEGSSHQNFLLEGQFFCGHKNQLLL